MIWDNNNKNYSTLIKILNTYKEKRKDSIFYFKLIYYQDLSSVCRSFYFMFHPKIA